MTLLINIKRLTHLSLLACATLFINHSFAQTQDKKTDGPWSVSIGAGVISTNEYEGGKKRVASLLPDINIGYKTKDFGSFELGSKSRGASWTFIENDAYALGVALGVSAGRTDKKDGTAFAPGSKRLNGMGEINPAAEFAVFGSATVGVPINLRITKGLGDDKVDANDFSIKGHKGTLVDLNAYIPIPLNKSLSLSFTPGLVWADEKYTNTFFGVTAAQSARSGFAAYNAKGGLKSIGVDIGLVYQYDKNWSGNLGVSASQLQGDAAKSPIVEQKLQTSVTAGIGYKF